MNLLSLATTVLVLGLILAAWNLKSPGWSTITGALAAGILCTTGSTAGGAALVAWGFLALRNLARAVRDDLRKQGRRG